MENNKKILQGYSDMEKGAYLGAVASIATADREALEEEMEYISALCDSADLTEPQKSLIKRAATELTGEELNRCLDVLKNSDLRFSLITDLIAFAESDNEYSPEEKQNIQKIAQYLGVNQEQFSLLDQFTHKAKEASSTEEVSKPEFLSSSGLQDKMQSAGINGSSLLKGVLGIAGPMILAGLVSRSLSGGRRYGGYGGYGGFGMGGYGGGFGSIISMLNGGRGYRSSRGLFSRFF